MEPTALKVLVVSGENEDSSFLNGGFHEANDCHLTDVQTLRANVQDVQCALRMITELAPNILLLDSTLTWQFVLGTAIRVREQLPTLPVLLLPNIHAVVGQPEVPTDVVGDQTPRVAAIGTTPDTIARTMRYTIGYLGLQRRLLQMALRDDLTGLHNRRGFVALATQHLRWARDARQPMLMFFADLDGLKGINDQFGHGEGDRAISLTAACIKQTFRKFDVTGRLGGDEFVALIQEEPGRSADAICRRLQMNLADCAGDEDRYKLSLSIGVAHFDPDKPATLLELMKRADTALYQHKRRNQASVSGGLTAVNSEASTRAGGAVKRPVLGESTAAVASNRWLSVAPLELNPSGNL